MEKFERCRSWFVVINKKAYTNKINYENLEEYIINHFNVAYFCYCEERGHGKDENEGNEHIHLYLELNNGMSFSAIQKKLNGAHIEKRRGNPKEARNYVFKIGTPENLAKADTNIQPAKEFGNWAKYENIIARGYAPVEANLSLNEKLEHYINTYNSVEEVERFDLWFSKQYKEQLARGFAEKRKKILIDKIGQTFTNPNNGEEFSILNKKIYYLYSDSQCGKSFNVRYKYGGRNVYVADCSKAHPYDNYKTEAVLMLEEFRSSYPLGAMLTLLDIYMHDLDARYFPRDFLAEEIIIATNDPINAQYKDLQKTKPKDFEAFKNRFVNGVWFMFYNNKTDKTYIVCLSKLEDYTNRAQKRCDFSDPPVFYDDDKIIFIKNNSDLYIIIEHLIARGLEITVENIEKDAHKPIDQIDFNNKGCYV